MSTTAPKELNETEKKIRLNEITELLNGLGGAIISKEFQINLKPGQKWNYISEGNIFEYDAASIFQLSDRGVFAKLVDALGMVKFYKNPDARKLEPYIKEPGKLFMQFCNSIVELHIQEQMIEEHPGTYTILEYLFCKEDALISGDVEKNLPPHMQYLYALPKLFWKKPISHFNNEVIEALEKTESALFRACSTEDVNETIAIASTDIWDTFYALYQDPPEDPNGGGGGGSGTGGMSEEEKSELKKALEGSRSMSGIKEKMKELSENKEEGADSKENFKADVEAEFDEKESRDSGGQGQGGDEPEDEILEMAKEGGGHGANPQRGGYYSRRVLYPDLYKEIYHMIPPFKKKLASIMKDNLYNRNGGSYRTGKLDTKKLYKVATGSDKVFSRKVQRSHKDYKVTILVDESGSMGSDKKNYYAALGCSLLAEVLSGAHIDFEIIGFNGTIRVYKKFGEKFSWDTRTKIECIIPNSCGGSEEYPDSDAGCNDDGYAVNFALNRMRRNSERTSERMLFVLSDGFPAESGRTLAPAEQERTGHNNTRDFDLRTEIEAGEHDTKIVGIGINARHVQNYYDSCAIVDEVSELPEVILSLLKGMIKRG